VKTLDEMKPFDGFAGVIGISAKGEVYYADTHPYMVWASYDQKADVFA
jgi:L-asparaginase